MALPKVLRGSYISDIREVRYVTHCQHCPHLKECKKRRAPIEDCETVAEVVFLAGGDRKVSWSGVIDLKKIHRIVHDYLENEPPPDVALPPVQMRMEL